MSPKRRSTVVLVAERAGVSIASVSRVLNGLPTSPEVKAKVEAAARELDYVPDATARSLKVGKTEQIAFAVPDLGNPAYVTMMRAVTDVVAGGGYRLVMSSTGSDPDAQIDLLRSVNRGYADGLILVPLRITAELVEELSSSRLPIAVVGTLPDSVPIDNVRAVSADGVGMALDHLYANGRRHIAFVNGPVDTVPGAARLAGYLAAMKRIGLPTTAELQVEADDFTFDAGMVAAQALLAQATPDAVMCANDLLAVATMKVLARADRAVPADVAVVGMDDSDLAELASPSLTSVNLGAAERAAAAAELLLSRLADPGQDHRHVIVEPQLTVRESSMHAPTAHPSRGHRR